MSIAESIQAARKRVREIVENCHYDGLCTVYTYGKTVDKYGITTMGDVPVLSDLPCHLSIQTVTSSNQTDSADQITKIVKLFAPPNDTIPAGSKIVVAQAGKTTAYQCSGEPAIYDTHQEVVLKLFTGWA